MTNNKNRSQCSGEAGDAWFERSLLVLVGVFVILLVTGYA